ncbi:CBS domain-containing protein [Metabacillus sp. FJAT-53654]|uniref:CBS domain-containing protein n=1 Tax=Metabacillus rhizosphaerae TaxID=3117747 RepID=A0ABZ2MP80_9BACI
MIVNITEVMTINAESCTPESTCKEVAVKMKDLDVGVIPICDNQKLVGIITDRDLVLQGLANNLSSESTIAGLMSKDVVTGTKDMSIKEAANVMSQEKIRRLPIVEKGNLVGIVSLGDLAINNQSNQKAGNVLEEISMPAEPKR